MIHTADNITDAQIHELRAVLEADLAALVQDPCFWTSHIRKAITETEWALSTGEPIRARQARGRCAEMLNARAQEHCRGREHRGHVRDVCEGSCCTSCGGPIDENEECRCG